MANLALHHGATVKQVCTKRTWKIVGRKISHVINQPVLGGHTRARTAQTSTRSNPDWWLDDEEKRAWRGPCPLEPLPQQLSLMGHDTINRHRLEAGPMKSVEHTGMAENRNRCYSGPWSPPSGSRDGIHQVVQVAAPDCNADDSTGPPYACKRRSKSLKRREREKGIW